jgi:hypothetical protein
VVLPDVFTGCDRIPLEIVAEVALVVLQLSVTNPVVEDTLPVKEWMTGGYPDEGEVKRGTTLTVAEAEVEL